MLTQITSGREFDEDNPSYVPVNEYVRKAAGEVSAWLIEGLCKVYIAPVPALTRGVCSCQCSRC